MKPTYSHPSRKADSCGPRLGIGSSGCPVFPFGVVSAPSYPTIRLVTPCATAHRGNFVRRTPSRQCTAVVAAHRVSCYPDGCHPPCIFGSLPRGGNGSAVVADQLNPGWLIPCAGGEHREEDISVRVGTASSPQRGEHPQYLKFGRLVYASSPRARVKPKLPRQGNSGSRTIPARAGETWVYTTWAW